MKTLPAFLGKWFCSKRTFRIPTKEPQKQGSYREIDSNQVKKVPPSPLPASAFCRKGVPFNRNECGRRATLVPIGNIWCPWTFDKNKATSYQVGRSSIAPTPWLGRFLLVALFVCSPQADSPAQRFSPPCGRRTSPFRGIPSRPPSEDASVTGRR